MCVFLFACVFVLVCVRGLSAHTLSECSHAGPFSPCVCACVCLYRCVSTMIVGACMFVTVFSRVCVDVRGLSAHMLVLFSCLSLSVGRVSVYQSC